MMRILGVVALGALLTGCVSAAETDRKPLDSKISAHIRKVPETLEGQSADALIRQFGTPILDAREMQGRKLQFGNSRCVLDAYLYPKGGREPVVIHVDARNRDGETVDTKSCIAALTK